MSAVDVLKSANPTPAIKLVRDIVDVGRDIAAVKFSKEDVSLQLEPLERKLSAMKVNLDTLSSLLHGGSQACSSQIFCEYRYLQLNIDHLSDDVNNLQKRIRNINEERKGVLFRNFASLTKKPVDEINEKITCVLNGSNDLYEKVRALTSSGEGPVTGLDGNDRFVRVTDMVPNNPEGVYFDFESTDTDGKPLTRAGQLKAAILDESPSQSKSVVAYGMGGAGKTCALRAIGQEKEIVNRFNGGVLYIFLGEDAGEKQLKDQIAKIVARAGGCHRAKEIRGQDDRLDDIMDKAVPWFSRHSCLFIIDDIWPSQGITKETLVTLSNLAKHNRSRIVYTMRYSKLQCGTSVDFTPRPSDRSSAESKNMLLNTAKLEYPSSEQARQSFDAILRSCGGLPLALSIAGGAVRFLASKKSASNLEEAWHKYDSVWKMGDKDDCDDMTKRLLKSLSFIDPGTDTYFRRFEAMSVLRKGQNVSLKTLSTLWNVDISVAEEVVKVFDRFSIVRSVDDDSGGLVAGLHDIILDISVARARAQHSVQSLSRAFIKRLLTIGKQEDADEASHASRGYQGRELTSEEFQHATTAIGNDKYTLSNLCWLLKLGGMKMDLLWLVSQPLWIVKRLNEENKREVLADIEMASESLSDISLNSMEVHAARDWLYRLTNCLQLSMSSIICNPHSGMAWFQLYGRLMYSKSKNSFVRAFLQRIEADVPKPWLKPVYGCLPPAGENLRAVVDTPGRFLHFVYQQGLISVISGTEREFVNTVHDAKDGTEQERYVLAADISEWHMKSSFSNNGKTFVCSREDGSLRVWTFSTKVSQREEDNYEDDDAELSSHEGCVQQIKAERPKASKLANIIQKIRSKRIRALGATQDREVISNEECTSEGRVAADPIMTDEMSRSSEIRQPERIVTGKTEKKWECAALPGHSDWIQCVAISGDGKVVVSGSYSNTVRVWENVGGKWEDGHCLIGHIGPISCVAISGDGKVVVSGSYDNTVRVWVNVKGKWESGHCLTGHTDLIRCLAMSGDQKVVVSGSEDNTVRVWENVEGKWKDGHCLKGHTGPISCVAISGDGKVVVSGSDDKTVRVSENVEGKWEDGHCLTGHTGWIECVAISGDQKVVVSGSDDNTVRVWENVEGKWEDGLCLTGHTSPISCVAISGDGKVVVSGSGDRTVRVWENVEGKREDDHCLTAHTDWIRCVSISGDGKLVVSGSRDNTVRVWENVEGKWDDGHCLTGHTDLIRCVAISNDRKVVVSGSYDNTVRVWENVEGKWESGHCLIGHTAWIKCVAISNDGKMVVSGSCDKTVRVWVNMGGKWEDGHCLKGHTSLIRCLAISSDQKVVVSGSEDNTVRVWENVEGKWEDGHCLTGHTHWSKCVAISDDGKKVVSGSYDNTVRVWENVEGKWEDGHCLTGHTDRIKCVAISGDGMVVVSGARDNTVRVWENVEGKWEDVHCLTGHTDWIKFVALSAGGEHISSESYNGETLQWRKENDVWSLWTDARRVRNYLDIRISEVDSGSEAVDELKSIFLSKEETLRECLDGGKLLEREKVANLLGIESVRIAVGADGGWTVRDGYCLRLRRAPFILFINWEGKKDVLFST